MNRVKLNGITFGDQLEPAMSITDQAVADQYFELLVAYQMGAIACEKSELPGSEIRTLAERNVKLNLGYFAGYYGRDTQKRVNELFKTTHPIFGG